MNAERLPADAERGAAWLRGVVAQHAASLAVEAAQHAKLGIGGRGFPGVGELAREREELMRIFAPS